MLEDLNTPTPIIRKALENVEFSRHVLNTDNENIREAWIQSELFQVLRIGFDSTGSKNYKVGLESWHANGRADIMIVDQGLTKRYIIEVKRASERDTLSDLPSQIENAQNAMDVTRSFAFVFAETEDDLRENNDSLDGVVTQLLDDGVIESDDDIFIKGPESVVDYQTT